MRWLPLSIPRSQLVLANTLPVGQSFLWHHRNGIYSRAVDNPPRVVLLRQTDTDVEYTAIHAVHAATEADLDTGLTKLWIEDYFQLEHDLDALYTEWKSRDPLFDAHVHGVRVLRQDPWECLIAFITSTNNHIPRITMLMHKLCTTFSPLLLIHDDVEYHLFPSAEHLPDKLEKQLRELGFGYRAGFIDATVAALRAEYEDVQGGLESWRELPLEEARERLVALKGVGRKVADCVMLMCLDQPSCIPIDTHVAAIAARDKAFPARLKKPVNKQIYDEVQKILVDKWGPMGGWCQAVMFAADLRPKKRPRS